MSEEQKRLEFQLQTVNRPEAIRSPTLRVSVDSEKELVEHLNNPEKNYQSEGLHRYASYCDPNVHDGFYRRKIFVTISCISGIRDSWDQIPPRQGIGGFSVMNAEPNNKEIFGHARIWLDRSSWNEYLQILTLLTCGNNLINTNLTLLLTTNAIKAEARESLDSDEIFDDEDCLFRSEDSFTVARFSVGPSNIVRDDWSFYFDS